MNYGFPQISNTKAIELMTGELDSDKKFELLLEANNKVWFQRCVDLQELDEPLTEELLDPSIVFSEITGQDNQFFTSKSDRIKALQSFREKVINLAKEFGYPKPFKSNQDASEFNHRMAILLWSIMSKLKMTPVNASSDGTWNVFQIIGCPSVACWRWERDGKVVKNRMIGNGRGAYSTVWWRYAILTDYGKYAYEDWMFKISEDPIGNILDRAGIRGYTPVVREFLKRVVKEQEIGRRNHEKYFRTATIQFRIKSSSVNFWYLLEKGYSAEEIVDELFDATERLFK